MSDETHWVLIFSPSLNRGRWKLSNCMDGKSLLMQISDIPCNWKCESAIIRESSWHYMLKGHIRCWRWLRKHPRVSEETSVGDNQPRKHPWVKISRGNIRGWKSAEETSVGENQPRKHPGLGNIWRSAGVGRNIRCDVLQAAAGGRGCKLISVASNCLGQHHLHQLHNAGSGSNAGEISVEFGVKSYLGQAWHSVTHLVQAAGDSNW